MYNVGVDAWAVGNCCVSSVHMDSKSGIMISAVIALESNLAIVLSMI